MKIGVFGPPPFDQDDREGVADPEGADSDQAAESLGAEPRGSPAAEAAAVAKAVVVTASVRTAETRVARATSPFLILTLNGMPTAGPAAAGGAEATGAAAEEAAEDAAADDGAAAGLTSLACLIPPEQEPRAMPSTTDSNHVRDVMSKVPTGVTVVFVGRESTSWPQLNKATVLGISTLGSGQTDFCRKLG